MKSEKGLNHTDLGKQRIIPAYIHSDTGGNSGLKVLGSR